VFVELAFKLEAIAIPSAAEIEVEEWPTPKYRSRFLLGNQKYRRVDDWYENFLFDWSLCP
jgi:hypothetical protein